MKHNNSFDIPKSLLKTPVNIYGSGISGLTTAYNFHRLGFLDINIFTKGRGIIQSLETEDGVVEFAANSILQNNEVTNLLNYFEIEYEYYSALGKKKFIFHNGKASRWPLSFSETMSSLPAFIGLIQKKDSFKPKKDETLNEWGKRTVGKSISEKLIQTGLKGIYGPNTGELSASLCLGLLFSNNKSASKGSISFKNGMGSFIKRFENELSISGVKFNSFKPDSNFDEEKKEGINIICTPTYSLPKFINSSFPDIEYHPISVSTYIVDEESRLPFKGFGCLFPDNKEGVLGVILNSDLFDNRAPEGKVSETWILRGDVYTDELNLEILEKFRADNFKVSFKDNKKKFFKHWEKAFPIYNTALERELEYLNKEEGVYFFSNWTGKIGIGRLIEDSPAFVKNIIKDYSRRFKTRT